jgi:predicted transcriptional regulator
MDEDLWKQLLLEADRSGDGKVTFEEFRVVMREMVRKSWLRVADRSPEKSKVSGSPVKSYYGGFDSPTKVKYLGTNGSPLKRNIINPE